MEHPQPDSSFGPPLSSDILYETEKSQIAERFLQMILNFTNNDENPPKLEINYEEEVISAENFIKTCTEAIKTTNLDYNNAIESVKGDGFILFNFSSLIPVVEAKKNDDKKCEEPEKPPDMKTEELELEKSPHAAYKDHEYQTKWSCSGYKTKKILRDSLVPTVTGARQNVQSKITDAKTVVAKTVSDTASAINQKFQEFLQFIRHPDNCQFCALLVPGSGILGFFLGRRSSRYRDSLLKGFFWGGLGLLGSGFLCHPKETDEYFRTFADGVKNTATGAYNIYEGVSPEPKPILPCSQKPCPKKTEKEKKKEKPVCEDKKKDKKDKSSGGGCVLM